MDEQEIAHKKELLEIYKRNRMTLLRQVAFNGGEVQAPLTVINALYESKRQIESILEELRAAGVRPEDLQRAENSNQPLGSKTKVLNTFQNPKLYAASIIYRSNFQEACDQISQLRFFKDIHDQLHKLQYQCYNVIVLESRRFPRDSASRHTIAQHALTLAEIIDRFSALIQQPVFEQNKTPFVLDFVGELLQAKQDLEEAIERRDRQQLDQALNTMRRILALHPTKVNAYLVVTARKLPIARLMQVLIQLQKQLEHSDIDDDQRKQLGDDIMMLSELNSNAIQLVNDHNQWQNIDLDLRLLSSTLEKNPAELERSWPKLKEKIEPLYNEKSEEWAVKLREESRKLELAIVESRKSERAIKGKRLELVNDFWWFHRLLANRFLCVDANLKDLCNRLAAFHYPLAEIQGAQL